VIEDFNMGIMSLALLGTMFIDFARMWVARCVAPGFGACLPGADQTWPAVGRRRKMSNRRPGQWATAANQDAGALRIDDALSRDVQRRAGDKALDGVRRDLLIYSAPFYPLVGGMERYAEDLASGLTELGFDVELATRTPANAPDLGCYPFIVTRIAGYLQLARVLLRHRQVLFVGLTFYDVVLAAVLRRRIVVTHHGPYALYDSARGWFKGTVKRRMAGFFPGICVSHNLAQWFDAHQQVIHNGYRDDVFNAPAGQRAAGGFAFVGRLVTEKGVDLLIRSFARLRAAYPEVRLSIVGDGPERDALIRLAADSGCGGAVTFMGSRPPQEVAALLATQRCLVVPSVGYEPFGIVALEGLAAGCEVIVTRRGGLPEAVGDFGWVVAPEIDAMSEAMAAVHAAQSRRAEPGITSFLHDHERMAVARRYAVAIGQLASRCL